MVNKVLYLDCQYNDAPCSLWHASARLVQDASGKAGDDDGQSE